MINRGKAHTSLHQFDAALADFDRAIEVAPQDAHARFARGVAHRLMGHLDRAIADLNRSLELDPQSPVAHENLGFVHRLMGSPGRCARSGRRSGGRAVGCSSGPPARGPGPWTGSGLNSVPPAVDHPLSAEAAVRLGRRAVLVLKDARNRPPSLPGGVIAVEYAPFSALFPRSVAVVHHGGVGTTGLALRSGRPTLVVPLAHDQPDNAARLARLGVARTIPRRRDTPARAVAEMRRLLDDPSYSQRASEPGSRFRQEDGVGAACDALEAMLGLSGSPRRD